MIDYLFTFMKYIKKVALSTLEDIPTTIRRHFRIKIVVLYHTVVSPITLVMHRKSLFYFTALNLHANFTCILCLNMRVSYKEMCSESDVNNFPL